MSILQVDGITFGNSTQLNTYYGIIPQNTTMVFYQAAAPTGWVQDTTQNDKSLRVVDGVGGSFYGISPMTGLFTDAGVDGPVSATIDGSIEETTLTEDQLPPHTHNTGSNPNAYRSSASSSPFRQDNRQPRGYNFRGSTRATQDNRVIINFRQPINVRQPRNFRNELRSRNPLRNRQPRNFRVRYPARSRNPISYRVPIAFRVDERWRNPITYRQPRQIRLQTFRRQPAFRGPFRQPRPWGRQPVRNQSIRLESPVRFTRLLYRNRFPISFRQRRQFRQPRNFRQPRSFRQRRAFRNRQPRSFRVRYEFRQRRAFRQPVPFRVEVPQRNPAAYRQPRQYRIIQRYPAVTNVRVSQRTLSPGGTIRNSDDLAPATSSSGGGLGHTHPFNPAPISFDITLSPLRVQYIDVIICTIEDAATKFGI